jgi:hypothetical protein
VACCTVAANVTANQAWAALGVWPVPVVAHAFVAYKRILLGIYVYGVAALPTGMAGCFIMSLRSAQQNAAYRNQPRTHEQAV